MHQLNGSAAWNGQVRYSDSSNSHQQFVSREKGVGLRFLSFVVLISWEIYVYKFRGLESEGEIFDNAIYHYRD